jgi:hypothetical protein
MKGELDSHQLPVGGGTARIELLGTGCQRSTGQPFEGGATPACQRAAQRRGALA